MPDGIARALSRYLESARNGGNEKPIMEVPANGEGQDQDSLPARATAEDFCPNCQKASLITQQGCLRCAECGYKEC